ncbi:hypothetical protein CANTEDRAFT_113339 [Yamadazyma tenuis ATCC 10573]|uniref:Uncharacterized protein n=1 Tax=Candida tenuis (strain ATCC 10573 / BCRC 21748 / CBS 615 / JCM 9827 / NBRC 10315 / NRRL Y-1498 / VKM Y-70) TaxID=590646 RepID=G3B205_CANTC|nr:uncharacterized protein CANTEDRAFT_113339 [Yamadazyma tenuis ATCC 10573]EGV64573.1 hypothetical protein CANTEDRAFT_113339 [Yamadazyma tenuis ATCC 10573]
MRLSLSLPIFILFLSAVAAAAEIHVKLAPQVGQEGNQGINEGKKTFTSSSTTLNTISSTSYSSQHTTSTIASESIAVPKVYLGFVTLVIGFLIGLVAA